MRRLAGKGSTTSGVPARYQRFASFGEPSRRSKCRGRSSCERIASEALHVAPQVLIEFRNAATRPALVNGLGMSIAEVQALSADFEQQFSLLEETPAIYTTWKAIVAATGTIGKQVHDARLVAVCLVHSVSHILTFNSSDFKRYAGFGSGLSAVDPATI